jgi:two-component system NtrC family sensor kinase
MEDQGFTRIKEIKKLLSSNSFELNNFEYKAKPIKAFKSIFEKKVLTSFKINKQTELEQKYLHKEELRSLLSSISEVKELPAAILKLPALSSFETCHVLVHEKGKPVGQNYLAVYGENKVTKLIAVQNFNSLFNLVKKSKNKIFSQSVTLKDDLSVVGNFLAKEIDLKNYSVIYLMSRNSFLPPSIEEQDEFQQLSSFLHPLLLKILDKEKNDLKKEVLRHSLENFPEKISIKKNNQIIFTNKTGQTSDENLNLNLMIFPLEAEDNSTIMELSNFSKDKISTELYHSQRVSLLGELLNTLQHELSNPLFGLNLTSSILEDETNNEETASILNEISQNANRSQTIIKNFSNLYNDQQEFKKINLYRFIDEVMTLTKSETKEIAKSIQTIGFDPNNPTNDLEITTNPTCLTQIIFNLVINAAQAIKEHGTDFRKNKIVVRLTKMEKMVEISIIDDGPGVKLGDVSTIFQPFFTTKDSGTGLGLSICQNLAHQLGSKIEFKNNSPLLGATFSINLPV